jgi:hypothetical protein
MKYALTLDFVDVRGYRTGGLYHQRSKVAPRFFAAR